MINRLLFRNTRRIMAAVLALLLAAGLCPIALADGENQSSAVVQVVYASPEGNFAFERVNVSPQNNVVSPNASLVPSGYVGVNTNPVPLIFNRAGSPIPSVIYFTYQLAPAATPTPAPYQPVIDPWQLTAGWQIPGQVIVFGQYEQDNNRNNGKEPVEWIVLRVEGARALLLSRYGLDVRRFNEQWIKVSWKDCTMRSWLNSVFYNECFTVAQKQAILQTGLESTYVDRTVQTQDYVFALSLPECNQYLSASLTRCKPTRYAQAQEAAASDGYCYWWLRDTTQRKNDANRMEPNGEIREYGANTNAAGVCVRPAIWVNLAAAFGAW